jgi:hypothetical protein
MRATQLESGQDIPENAGRDITTTTDGDHQVGVEFLEDSIGRLLAQLVHLVVGDVELLDHFGGLEWKRKGLLKNEVTGL